MRITGIEINKYFKKLLQEDLTLSELVPKKNIQPLVLAPTSYPFISFTHDEIVPVYSSFPNKSSNYDQVVMIIAAVDTDYERSIGIISRIREMFEYRKYEDEYIKIDDFQVLSISENVEKDAYIQQLILKFEVYSK